MAPPRQVVPIVLQNAEKFDAGIEDIMSGLKNIGML